MQRESTIRTINTGNWVQMFIQTARNMEIRCHFTTNHLLASGHDSFRSQTARRNVCLDIYINTFARLRLLAVVTLSLYVISTHVKQQQQIHAKEHSRPIENYQSIDFFMWLQTSQRLCLPSVGSSHTLRDKSNALLTAAVAEVVAGWSSRNCKQTRWNQR
jgi:hypothetical protein